MKKFSDYLENVNEDVQFSDISSASPIVTNKLTKQQMKDFLIAFEKSLKTLQFLSERGDGLSSKVLADFNQIDNILKKSELKRWVR